MSLDLAVLHEKRLSGDEDRVRRPPFVKLAVSPLYNFTGIYIAVTSPTDARMDRSVYIYFLIYSETRLGSAYICMIHFFQA